MDDVSISNLPTFILVLPASLLGFDDDLDSRFPIFPAFDTRLFLLQFFINFEKMFDLLQQVGRDFRQVLDVIPEWVGNGNAENFLIGPLLIPHLEQAYGPRLNDTAGKRWFPN
jgi:hypothetical protein